MSTNYYIKRPDGGEGLHLGKLSNGRFTMRAHSDLGIRTVEDWIPLLVGKEIIAEHGLVESFGEWLKMVIRSKPARETWEKYYIMDSVSFFGAWHDEEWDLIVIDHEFC